jgi:HAMP domain-containing protein
MADTPEPFADLRHRLEAVEKEGEKLQQEGLPFPTLQIRTTFDEATRSGATEQATAVVKRAEALLQRVSRDWNWVRELLRRVDELRTIAQELGVDLAHLDARVGKPRDQLMTGPLSAGSLEKAAASASIALAVLNDAVPKFCIQEAQALGKSIRRARDRGEDVLAAATSFSRLLQAIQDENLTSSASRLVETRRIVARIPRAPSIAAISPKEEEEILLEARNLARRLQRIKTSARDAQSAARLMTQVRAALSEDRRYGTPEEEIEALWQEVDRLTQEKRRATPEPSAAVLEARAPMPPPAAPPRAPAPKPLPRAVPKPKVAPTPPGPSLPERLSAPVLPLAPVVAEAEAEEAEERQERQHPSEPFSFYLPYVPPERSGLYDRENEDPADAAAAARRRVKSRP